MICILTLLYFTACISKPEKRKIGSSLVEAVFINDSIADGRVNYYTLEGKLVSSSDIKNGKKNGVTIFYYPDGKIYDSLNYLNDVPDGKHYRYDTFGNLIYQDFFIKGKKAGETFLYNNGKLVKYEFADSNNKLLYSSEYNSKGLSKATFKSIINADAEEIIMNGIPQMNIRFYWLNPPLVNIKYSLGKADTIRHIDMYLAEFTNGQIMKDTTLPVLSSPFCYFISATYSDTSNNFEKIYIQEF